MGTVRSPAMFRIRFRAHGLLGTLLLAAARALLRALSERGVHGVLCAWGLQFMHQHSDPENTGDGIVPVASS